MFAAWFRRSAVVLGLVCSVSISSAATVVDMDDQEKLTAAVTALVKARRFDRISEWSARELETQARLSDGLWRASVLHDAFQEVLRSELRGEAQWKPVLDALRQRADKKPADTILYAEALNALAWQMRGGGYASSVSPSGFGQFQALSMTAREVLDKRRPLLQGNPLWYSRRITLALEMGESAAVQDQLFADGIAAHPRYHGIFFARFRHLTPQWGGSEDEVMTLLGQVAGLGAAVSDEATYARLVWMADDTALGVQYHKAFNVPAMRAATRALVKRFPAQRNVQKMLFLACVRSDKALASELLPLVRGPTMVDVLGGGAEIYEDCLRWTRGELDAFIIRDRDLKGRVTERWVR